MLKKVKDLKKGDKVRFVVSDGRKHYPAWCVVKDVSAGVPIYKPNIVANREQYHEIIFIVNDGKLKGQEMGADALYRENATFAVPDRPGKLRRLWNEIISS